MKGKLLIIVLTLSLAVNASAVATIGYHYWRNACLTPSAPCPLNEGEHHPYQDLGLSPEQLARMTALAGSFHHRLNELEGAVETKRNLLIDCLGENQIDLPRTEALRKEIAGYQDEIQKEVIAHIADVEEDHEPRSAKAVYRAPADELGQRASPFAIYQELR